MEEKTCTNCCTCNIQGEHETEEKQNKKEMIFYFLSVILFLLSFLPIEQFYKIAIYAFVILLAGYELILEGIKNIFHFNFEEETLMTIAVVAAFLLGEFPESCMVVLLFRLGEFLEEKAVENSQKSIKNTVEIKVKTVSKVGEDGSIKQEKIEKIKVGDNILIKPGEMVPLDCKILQGTSSLDMSSITGESIPVFVKEEESILSGSINLNGSLTCLVQKDEKHSMASQMVDLVYEATSHKGKTEAFITKFSKIYTPVVLILALFIAILPPLIFQEETKTWIMRALVFLVASCPCSIVISVPLAFFSCIGAISKKGMVVKGTKHIENLAQANQIAFDKTGTLTTGKMKIEQFVVTGNYTKEEVLNYVYSLERNSNHPISTAIQEQAKKEKIEERQQVEQYEEIAGYGVSGKINQKEILFGNNKLLEKNHIQSPVEKQANYIIIDGKIEGYITFEEEIRNNVENIVEKLKQNKIENITMLTGDNIENANKIASKVGIPKVLASLLPKQKQEAVKELKKKGKVIFVGDGMNDSPVLAEADFGIAMKGAAEIAEIAADGIFISNRLEELPNILSIAKKTMRIVKENILFSLIIKIVVLTLGFVGIAPIWLAVAADTGVSLITVLNSIRILK